MRIKSSLCFIALVVIVFVTISLHEASAQVQVNSALSAYKEFVKTGLNLTSQAIQAGNYDYAKAYSRETLDVFAQSMQTTREVNPTIVNDIHLTLVDLQADVKPSQRDSLLQKIDHINSLLVQIPEPTSYDPNMLSYMLTAVDQVYQDANSTASEPLFYFANYLVTETERAYVAKKGSDSNQDSELKLYFAQLKSQMQKRASFATVGNTITGIQNNLLGTKGDYAKSSLYDNIRALYKQLISQIDTGNYNAAAETATTAYLDNFEYLEPDLRSVDPAFDRNMEITMRDNLRSLISSHAPAQVIKDKVTSILLDLDKAEAMVSKVQKTVPASSTQKNLPMGSATATQKTEVEKNVDSIRNKLQLVLNYYRTGNYQAAFTAARSAYLDMYEQVEIPLRTINPDFTVQVETQFSELRTLINNRAEYGKVEQMTIEIKRSLDESERQVTGTGTMAPGIAFTSSLSMIFREGLESVLIIGAILTYLEASRNTKFKPYIYYGALAAIGATAATWFVASYVIQISGVNRELVEAIAAISATGVLFYVSFWILSKIETKKWMEFVKAKVWQASATGGVTVFALLSFFTVYREGFETVLLYQALFGFAKYMETYVILGFVIGIAGLFVVYYIMRRLGRRLPLKWLFGLTMGVGGYLSIAFIGNAVREMQILDWIPTTNLIGIIPRLDINLATMTGIHPTLETVIAQMVLLGVYLIAGLYVLVIKPRKEEHITKLRKSRSQVEQIEEES